MELRLSCINPSISHPHRWAVGRPLRVYAGKNWVKMGLDCTVKCGKFRSIFHYWLLFLWCWGQNTVGEPGQCHDYWCPGSLCCQVINSQGTVCSINGSLFFMRMDFKLPVPISKLRKDRKCNIFSCFFNSVCNGLMYVLTVSKMVVLQIGHQFPVVWMSPVNVFFDGESGLCRC